MVVGDAYKKFIAKQVEKARNYKPRPFVANASIIQAAMIKSTDPAITEFPTAPHTDRPHEAKRQGIKTPVLVYDRATVHTSKEMQEELDRVFGKGNHEVQRRRGSFPKRGPGHGVLLRDQQGRGGDDRGGVVEDGGRGDAHGH